jgi:hypothetical protein
MTVDAIHPDVAEKTDMWRRTRDAARGEYAVRKAGETYLPKLSDQTADEYRNYSGRALFIEATGRTQDAMTGLVFAKEPVAEVPKGFEAYLDDIDGSGKDWQEFASEIVDDQQETGWGAIVVMHSGDPLNPGTRDAPSGRAFLQYYPAESVFNWAWGKVGAGRQLTSLRLKECADAVDPKDEFNTISVEQIRVYTVLPGGVTERIYQFLEDPATKKKEWKITRNAPLIADGKPLQSIPARLVAADGKRKPGKAPLSPLAGVNLSHWRTSADREHALHFCGLPTPFATGVSTPNRPKSDIFSALDASDNSELGRENIIRSAGIERSPSIKLGSSTVITFENPDATLQYLTMPVEGIGALQSALKDKEQLMAIQGARMLAAQSSQPESGEALAIRRSAETSPLAKLTNAVSEAIEDCLAIAISWDGGDGEKVTFRLNTEFVDNDIDGPTITALLGAVNAGSLSLDTFIYNMQKGGKLAPGMTVEDEKAAIADGPQPTGMLGGDPFGALPPVPTIPANDPTSEAA